MKIMLFGASGFLAQQVFNYLDANGHEVVRVFRNNSNLSEKQPRENDCILSAVGEIRELLVSKSPDLVINMTNFFTRTNKPIDTLALAEVNASVVTEICQGCLDADAVLLHVGSAWQSTLTIDDAGNDFYSLYKGIASAIVNWFAITAQLRALTINLYDTYGEKDPRGKIVQLLLSRIDSEEALDLSGGEQILELVHAEDVASAIGMLAEQYNDILQNCDSRSVPEFWCYPDEATTLKNLVMTIEAASGRTVLVNWGVRPYREGEKFSRELTNKQRVPNWNQNVSLKNGLTRFFS